tara:strand:- start:83 stop:1399 length:1317 start_codon:yes stop_codon:yes gene_type:complete
MSINVLVIGSGAREHAICKSVKKSLIKNKIFCFASNYNPGIANICNNIFVGDLNDKKSILKYALDKNIKIAIVGPENPLEIGISDLLINEKILVVGPKKNLAQLETSKIFTRELLKNYNINGCPEYKAFNKLNGVKKYLERLGNDYVVKYDGLAGGKGVKVSGDHLKSHKEAIKYCEKITKQNGKFIIEEKLHGEEFSLMSFTDGKNLKHMPVVQDHKRAFEGDKGPNTGGMGSYSCEDHLLPFLSKTNVDEAKSINNNIINALKNKFNDNYMGILYGGFILTDKGVKVIEYNARFGDPEVMNVLQILKSDFLEICLAICEQKLDNVEVEFKNQATVCKYAVPIGYPDNPIKGEKIDISKLKNQQNLFFGSLDEINGELIEAGSRTLAYVGVGKSLIEAEKISEESISSVKGPLFHRKDIGTNDLILNKINKVRLLKK